MAHAKRMNPMVTLPRTCPDCGSSLLHYGLCACQIPPSSLERTVNEGMQSIREAALNAAIELVEECARSGLSYERCLHHLRALKERRSSKGDQLKGMGIRDD